MSLLDRVDPEVFSVHEVAKAAGVAAGDVRLLLAETDLASAGDRYVPFDTAVELVRLLRTPGSRLAHRRLFSAASGGARKPAVPLAASGVLHAGIVLAVLSLTSLGLRSAPRESPPPEPARLVFLALPGPGGGGGGGGLKQPSPPPQARLKGKSPVASPIVVSNREEGAARERQVEPPPAPAVIEEPPAPPPPAADPAPAPPVAAPVASAPADADDLAGVIEEAAPSRVMNGPGQGGGAGTGQGTGMGEGSGSGIGDGSIAGTGGGPYRPGSGVTPPVLEREVKPLYTDEGRRRGVEGDVVMEVVVRADGTVGSVRVVQGLGSGLDARAADAVRQWRFAPARRHGRPVDVLVEVAVEFRLR